MKYLIINANLESSTALENIMDEKVVKDVPFGYKLKSPVLSYGNILIPYILVDETDIDFPILEEKFFNICKSTSGKAIDRNMIFSIYSLFKPIITADSLKIEITAIVDSENIGILYSDGSSSKKNSCAGYAVCKLTEESLNGVFDSFTNKNWNYESFSGKIENGTNNIGEITGVKISLLNMNESKPIYIVISDSELSMKTFREYVHVWKNNGWLTASKKPIKNKELVQSTYEILKNILSEKMVLFKWVKGHDKDESGVPRSNFNKICDELAKKESGVN